MTTAPFQSYQKTSVSTADRGKLVLMIYDHCLKWSRLALEAMEAGKVEDYTKAIFKVQDGITELTCSLDLEVGGDVAKNLHRLYTFYNRHLTTALNQRDRVPILQVQEMMGSLRGAWVLAIDKVRQENPVQMMDGGNAQIRMVG